MSSGFVTDSTSFFKDIKKGVRKIGLLFYRLVQESIVSDQADGATGGVGYSVLHNIGVGTDVERVAGSAVHMAG